MFLGNYLCNLIITTDTEKTLHEKQFIQKNMIWNIYKKQ